MVNMVVTVGQSRAARSTSSPHWPPASSRRCRSFSFSAIPPAPTIWGDTRYLSAFGNRLYVIYGLRIGFLGGWKLAQQRVHGVDAGFHGRVFLAHSHLRAVQIRMTAEKLPHDLPIGLIRRTVPSVSAGFISPTRPGTKSGSSIRGVNDGSCTKEATFGSRRESPCLPMKPS
jgi:hypothetical protein